ncbi:MAG: amino acid racemase [Bacteroidales bacterium]|nr:amino acid racemase [Bacteroidales bacterium]
MKKIGIVGGLGPVATMDYYKEIIGIFNERGSDLNYPEIIIYSVNMEKFLNLMKEKKYTEVVDLFARYINCLKNAGAEFAAITANTPHLLFNEIKEISALPLISIVEAVAEEAKKLNLKKTGLIGTRFTMDSTFYKDVFVTKNLQVIVPGEEDKQVIHQKLFSEIELGIFKDETRELLLDIVQKMKKENSIEGIILGCTEFPVLFREPAYSGIPFLNTTRIHVKKIVEYCLA